MTATLSPLQSLRSEGTLVDFTVSAQNFTSGAYHAPLPVAEETPHTAQEVERAGLTQTVILIRHGEKEGDDLSPRGEQRARCLAQHFAGAGITHLYAYTDHPSKRSVETITPLAKQLGLPIDTREGRDDVSALVGDIASLPSSAVVLVCWEHKVLSQIASALGVKDAPSYPSSEYDWQWTITEGSLKQADEKC